MGKDRVPGFNEVRRLLYQKNVSVEEIRSAAQTLYEVGRWDDALDLYQRAKDMEKVRAIAQQAFTEGDVGVWMKARRILNEPISNQEWMKIAEIARAAGKEHFAIFAYRRAGEDQKIEELLTGRGEKPSPGSAQTAQ